jgi:hypothetical protein
MTLDFRPEFVPLIVNGTKIHTIRSGQRWSVGQSIHFCTTGPQGAHQFRPNGTVTAVQAVIITKKQNTGRFEVDGRPLLGAELSEFARRDGFESPVQLLRFFIENYTLPFAGQLVHWTDVRY